MCAILKEMHINVAFVTPSNFLQWQTLQAFFLKDDTHFFNFIVDI